MSRERLAKNIPPPPEASAMWLSQPQVAGYLHVTPATIYRLRHDDPTFPQARILGHRSPRFLKTEIDAWMTSRPQGFTHGAPANLNDEPAAPAEPDTTEPTPEPAPEVTSEPAVEAP